MQQISVVAMVAAGVNRGSKSIVLRVLDAAGQQYELRLAEGMAGSMALAVTDQMRALQEDEKQATVTQGQSTALTDVRAFHLPDGRRGLAWTFEHALRVMSLLQPAMRQRLRSALDELDRLTIAEPPEKPAH